MSPALWISSSPQQRVKLLKDGTHDLCHYRREKKLLIINQIDLFGGDEVVKSELLLFLTNICTEEGQTLMGC